MKTSKKRLALFLPGLYEGGAERVMLNLAAGVVARGHPVDLVLARAEGPYMPQIPDGVRLVDLKAPRVLSSVPALTTYLRRERPAAMLSALYANLVAVWARKLCGFPKRLVLTEHNTLAAVVRHKTDLRWQAYPSLARQFYPWADAIIAVSGAVASELVKTAALSTERVQVVHNPIVTPELMTKANMPLDHPWFAVGGPPVILSIGRLTEQKAFDVLIRAFALVRKNQPARLLILGDGEERPALEALITNLGLGADVSLAGFVQNPYPYLLRSKVFVLSSRWEGLPTVLVEALCLGAPIVATDCPGGSREILQDGRFGDLVPVENPFRLAEAIERSMQARQGRPPHESWERFELDFIVDRYLDILFKA